MKTYWVYILKCVDNSFYTGVCNDIERRYEEHQNGEECEGGMYTSKRRPVELVYSEEFDDINQAIEREKQIKRWVRAKKTALINENWDRLIRLSKNYNLYPVTLRQAQGDI